MDYSELLHDWIDGTLASHHEEAVFIALSRQPELRTELQDLIRIRAAVQNDIEAFTPSPADTSAIFGRLGFSVPPDIPSLASAAATNAAATSTAGTSAAAGAAKVLSGVAALGGAAKIALANAWHSYGAVLASACVASLATVLLLDWRGGSGIFSSSREGATEQTANAGFNGQNGTTAQRFGNNGGGITGNGSSFANGSPFGNNSSPGNGSSSGNGLDGGGRLGNNGEGSGLQQYTHQSDTVHERVIVREIVKEIVRYVQSPSASKNNRLANARANALAMAVTQNEYAHSDQISHEAAQVQTVNIPKESAAESFSKQALKRSAAAPSVDNIPAMLSTATGEREETFTDVLHRFRLGVRGFTTLSLPAPSMEPSSTPFFNNAAISLQYALSPNHAVGVEVGQEAFFQQYKTTENQDTYLVSQYPTQWWAGLTYRYAFTPEELFSPFASATLGVAGYGFLGRTQVGCTYSPDGITQFLLGVEASALVYRHQGTNYVSPKVGVTYGVSLRF